MCCQVFLFLTDYFGACRLFYGFGLGLSLRCGPMYLREIVPASVRDSAIVSIKLSMVMGMILSYIVGDLIDIKLYGEPQHPH